MQNCYMAHVVQFPPIRAEDVFNDITKAFIPLPNRSTLMADLTARRGGGPWRSGPNGMSKT